MPSFRNFVKAALVLPLTMVTTAQNSSDFLVVAPIDPTIIQLPFKICRRLQNITKLDGWFTPDGLDYVDVGRCAGGCLGSSITGKKECSPTKTTSVTIYARNRPGKTKLIEVIQECACVCCDHHICPTGFFWDAQNCRCWPKVEVRPCERFSQYSNVFGALIDVGVCRGECDAVDEVCKPLVYGTEVAAANGALAEVQTVAKCGCSDCSVKPLWVAVEREDGTMVKVNVGKCGGTCGPETWPTDSTDLSHYWTTVCIRAETTPLYVSDTIVLERVTKCDCKAVRPKCQRVPRYITFWSATGEQKLDVGACEGRCGLFNEACVPTLRETVFCDGLDPTDVANPETAAACQKYDVIVECGCQSTITVNPGLASAATGLAAAADVVRP